MEDILVILSKKEKKKDWDNFTEFYVKSLRSHAKEIPTPAVFEGLNASLQYMCNRIILYILLLFII